MITKISLLYHTIKYLKLRQIIYRIIFKLPSINFNYLPSPKLRKPKKFVSNFIDTRQSLFSENEFKFLNKTRIISTYQDWTDNSFDDLWLYNLHYFDDLNAFDSKKRKTLHINLLDRWVNENLSKSTIGWQSYPISRRIVNWIKWGLKGNEFKDVWLNSLANQANHLSKNLEYHILGNHLFANAKALIFAGLFLECRKSKYWYEKGLKLVKDQIKEQILDDGGHFELSPMYHSIFLEDLLDIINIHNLYEKKIPNIINEKVEPMLNWIKAMSHPDKKLTFFNDSTFGNCASFEDLRNYAINLGLNSDINCEGVNWLKESGYICINKDTYYAAIDVGNIGPDYLPGHAHADTLSFELSVNNKRVFVNSGVSCYGKSAERLRQRSTMAHNTVCIDNKNSSEVWDGFRVAKRARPNNLKTKFTPNIIDIYCAHDGYTRLKGNAVHSRNFLFKNNSLLIHDKVKGKFSSAKALFHLHPNINVSIDASRKNGTIFLDEKNFINFELNCGMASTKKTTYHPEFGISQINECIHVDFSNNEIKIKFSW